MLRSQYLARRLAFAPPFLFTALAGVVAFIAYCCIYAFRKPFTAGSYAGLELFGVQFKIVLVLAQVAGYALSKFIGIRVISGMSATRRAGMLLGMIGIAGGSLLGFALTPHPWSAVWMFINGLPLGMAWGLIFGYLEGRRVTEALAAMLCANFIISSGFVKTVGKWLLSAQGVSEHWMPFVTALLFLPALLLCLWLLEHLPPPTAADQAQRSPRQQMDRAARKAVFKRFAPGLVCLIGAYFILTMVRDVRDNFAVEIWTELGFGGQSSILTTAEIPVAVLTLLAVGAMMFVKSNFRALWLNHALTILGAVLLFGSTMMFQQGLLFPVFWMIVSGFGLFLPYILFNGVVFDRLMAAFREQGNVGFLMYMADSVGYLGSVAVLLWRNFGAGSMSWLGFYTDLCYFGSGLILVFAFGSFWYFRKKANTIPAIDSTSIQ